MARSLRLSTVAHRVYRYTAGDGRVFHIAGHLEILVLSGDERWFFDALDDAKEFLAEYERSLVKGRD